MALFRPIYIRCSSQFNPCLWHHFRSVVRLGPICFFHQVLRNLFVPPQLRPTLKARIQQHIPKQRAAKKTGGQYRTKVKIATTTSSAMYSLMRLSKTWMRVRTGRLVIQSGAGAGAK